MTIVHLADGTLFDTDTKKQYAIRKNKRVNGVILYQGLSVISPDPIVVIATFNTANEKTGDMIQTWIIRSDISPVGAVNLKLDTAICGNCPHRHATGGACYVQPFQAPLSIYNSFKKGRYPVYNKTLHKQFFIDRSIRLGSYGDPAVVPFKIWKDITSITLHHTAYTHLIDHPAIDQRISELCMISVDTPSQFKRATERGLHTFRVKSPDSPLLDNEIYCLNSSNNIQCLKCGLCNGQSVNVALDVHGRRKNRFINKFDTISVKNI